MNGERPHQRLDVWKRSIDMVTHIYKLTSRFPDTEKFGLTSQMRRSAVSIPSNIAEGAARNSKKEFINYLHIAQGSSAELETQVVICRKLSFLTETESENLLSEINMISRLIIGLQRSLRGER